MAGHGEGSVKAILYALAANAGIAVAKGSGCLPYIHFDRYSSWHPV